MDEEIRRELEKLEKKIDELEDRQQKRELENYKWGVRVLGAVVIGLGSYIWAQVSHIFNFGNGP